MAIPATKTEFGDWCKRKLGYPVIDINVDADQVDDRVDEAIQYYQMFMGGGSRRMYLKHKCTQADKDRGKANTSETITQTTNQPSSTLPAGATATDTTITLADASQFPITGTVVISQGLGNAETKAYTAKSGNVLTIAALSNTHGNGATIALSVSDKWEIGETWLPMPTGVESVLRILPFDNKGSLNMFDIKYQLRLIDVFDLADVELINYTMVMEHLEFIDNLLVGTKTFDYNRHMDRLYVYMDWENDVNVGDYMVMEVYQVIAPNTYTSVYNDLWLKRYTTALMKKQWGQNLKKFDSITLPGGITYNGQSLYDEASTEIETLESAILTSHDTLPSMIIG